MQIICSVSFLLDLLQKNGHGFGLHSSALSAREMGGSLLADSKGEGCGAQFTLTLPFIDRLDKLGRT